MDDDQQFCLRWNNHQSTLISVFDTLLENGTLVDCTLAAEGKSMKAHKVVLSACSPYFANLLSQHYDKHPVFILKDVKYQELRAMMDYMYRGEVNISQDQLAALLKAAESLQIKGLSDNRSGGNNNNNAMNNKATENLVKPPPPVPAAKSTASGAAAGLTIENKRPLKSLLGVTADLDTDASVISREGSTSPSRKRKKTNVRRRSIESNNVLDNHEQLSNSSSHSTTHATNNITTSTTNVLPVTKKTDHHESKQTSGDGVGHDDAGGGADSANEDKSSTGGAGGKDAATHSELMIEPKNEYDDDDGTEPVEDLTLDDEDMMEDLDQAGPSHGGEGSSSGYGNWQMERSNDEFMTGQEAGQHRDAQGAEDLSITKIAGLTWDQWNARLAMPLVTTLREGPHPLMFPREFGTSPGSMDVSGGKSGNGSGGSVGNAADQQPNFSCPDCGRMYKLKSSLRNHQKWECGKEPQFQCPYCVYRAKQKMHIGRHMERMHKERFFKVESDKVVALDMGSELSNIGAMNMGGTISLSNMNMNNTC